jgi:hypothetical protein
MGEEWISRYTRNLFVPLATDMQMDNEEQWAFKDKSKIIHTGDFKKKNMKKMNILKSETEGSL